MEELAFKQNTFLFPMTNAIKIAHANGIDWGKLPKLTASLAPSYVDALRLLCKNDDDKQLTNTALRIEQDVLKRTLSPIEQLFIAYVSTTDGFSWVTSDTDRFMIGGWSETETFSAQVKIEGFIVDFLLRCDTNLVVIELDGHEWHERSKEQAAADKSRDRILQSLGYKVLRFTGTEIWKDPSKCVYDALAITGILFEVQE